MALPRTASFGQFNILLGDGADPEVFTAPCGLTKKDVKFDGKASSVIVPDCDDPEAPAWEDKAISALSGAVTGDGILSMADLARWNTWFQSGLDKNIQVWIDLPGAQGGGYWSGAAILSSFEISSALATEGNRCTVKVQIDNDGSWPWTPNPA
jgi:hypothetical protein